MKFTIITPTYNRVEGVIKTASSVMSQVRKGCDIEHVIINDSPLADYGKFEKILLSEEYSHVKYIKNKVNSGVNHSRNTGLDLVREDADYVIFLDDDDWLANSSFENLNNIVGQEKRSWYLLNRSVSGKKLINVKKENFQSEYDYFWDFLICKNISGDGTHILSREVANSKRFSKKIKQGEELVYFIALKSTVKYYDVEFAESDGYLDGGLSSNLENLYLSNTKKLYGEILSTFSFKLLLYTLLRSVKSFLPFGKRR